MAKYLITYHNAPMPSNPDPAMMEKMKMAFGMWIQESGKAIVDPGAPVRTLTQVSGGSHPAPAEIGGYSIIEAGSADEAVKLLKSHPFISRGGTLQVNELMVI